MAMPGETFASVLMTDLQSDVHVHGTTRRAAKSAKIGSVGVLVTSSALLIQVTYTLRTTKQMPTGWAQFGLHPLLMTLAFGFLAPIAVTSYRGLEDICNLKHGKAKALHAFLMSSSLACGIAGVVDMWIVHSAGGPGNHLISVHSWLGLATLIAFAFQWLSGFLAFYTPVMERIVTARAWLPAHIFIGCFSIFGTLASIALGILSLEGRGEKPDQIQFKVASLLTLLLAMFVGLALNGGRNRQ